MSDSWLKIGKVKGAHGIKGELYILVFSGQMDWLPDIEFISLKAQELQVEPQVKLPVLDVRPHKKGFIFKTQEITNRTDAEKFVGWELFLPTSFFTTQPEEDHFFLREIEGFRVTDKRLGPVGQVVGFVSHSAQDLIRLKSDEGEFLVPLVKAFILNVDRSQKVLSMDLPEGLLDISLDKG